MKRPSKYLKLYQQLKSDIIQGNYAYEEPLPSIRNLSNNLKLSRTTIEHAYGQLQLEGYVYAVQGVGYYANILAGKSHFIKSKRSDTAYETDKIQLKEIVYDFKNEYADPDAMDLKMWKKHINYVFANESDKLLEKLEPSGERELRERIANYVYMARGIEVDHREIIIGAGIQSLLSGLLPTIKNGIKGLAVEDPGFKTVSDAFLRSGFNIAPIPLTEQGVDIDTLYRYQNHLCYVSPAHQFPTGTVMQIENRVKLIQWARDTNSYILEDDYNASLRYELFPVSSLKSLDVSDLVIYLGSFSTYMVPGIRISYMILPKALRENYLSVGQTASKLERIPHRYLLLVQFQRRMERKKEHLLLR
jgi:GntR family transcriptional regulator/MocR family aminotransferase